MLNLKTQIDIVKYSLLYKNFSARGRPGGVGPPSVNLGPPNISENKRARKLKLKTPLDIRTFEPRVQKKIPLGSVQGGTGPPNVNLGPPKVSETTRARMLKLKIQLDIVKYSLLYKNFSARGRSGRVGPPSVKLGPPNISEVKELES